MNVKSSNGRNWIVRKGPSIFASRKGKEDVRILRQNSDWGGMEFDGKRYTTAMVFDAENAEVIRNYEVLPDEITIPLLRQWGFIGGCHA